MSKLASKGDSKALQFFATIKASNPLLAAEYDTYLNGGEGNAAGIRRADLKGIDTSILSNKQFGVAVSMSVKFKQGSGEATKFFAMQDEYAAKGSALGKKYIEVRDAVIALTEEELKAIVSPAAPAVVPAV